MKRLFKVVDSTKKASSALKSFEVKVEAKSYRDELNSESPTAIYRVGRGPDHWKGESRVAYSSTLAEKVQEESGKKQKTNRKWKKPPSTKKPHKRTR